MSNVEVHTKPKAPLNNSNRAINPWAKVRSMNSLHLSTNGTPFAFPHSEIQGLVGRIVLGGLLSFDMMCVHRRDEVILSVQAESRPSGWLLLQWHIHQPASRALLLKWSTNKVPWCAFFFVFASCKRNL